MVLLIGFNSQHVLHVRVLMRYIKILTCGDPDRTKIGSYPCWSTRFYSIQRTIELDWTRNMNVVNAMRGTVASGLHYEFSALSVGTLLPSATIEVLRCLTCRGFCTECVAFSMAIYLERTLKQ